MEEKKKKDVTPLPLKIMAWLFPRLERIVPGVAKRIFVHIFFTPAKYPFPEKEKIYVEKAEKEIITFRERKVMTYKWGEGKPVLMMHGWMGRATQFRKFIDRFTSKGYQVIAFDAPAHGKSGGIKSHLMYFVEVIELMHEKYSFNAIIGHSLGGVAGIHMLDKNIGVSKLVMIGSPAIADKIIGEFLRRLNGSWKSGNHFKEYIKKTYKAPFEHYTAEYIAGKLEDGELLLIYDQDDEEVAIEHAEAIKQKYPSAKFMRTFGLGHTRILKDDNVINRAFEFIDSHP